MDDTDLADAFDSVGEFEQLLKILEERPVGQLQAADTPLLGWVMYAQQMGSRWRLRANRMVGGKDEAKHLGTFSSKNDAETAAAAIRILFPEEVRKAPVPRVYRRSKLVPHTYITRVKGGYRFQGPRKPKTKERHMEMNLQDARGGAGGPGQVVRRGWGSGAQR